MVYIVQNKEDLDRLIAEAGDKLVVIDFFANWCGPCKIISPKLEELAGIYADQAMVLKVNVDDCEDIAIEYNITSMPTFVFMKNGQILDVFVGGNSDKLASNMEQFVGAQGVPVCPTPPPTPTPTPTPPMPIVEQAALEEEQPQTAQI